MSWGRADVLEGKRNEAPRYAGPFWHRGLRAFWAAAGVGIESIFEGCFWGPVSEPLIWAPALGAAVGGIFFLIVELFWVTRTGLRN